MTSFDTLKYAKILARDGVQKSDEIVNFLADVLKESYYQKSELDMKFEQILFEVDKRLDKRFEQVDRRFEQVNKRFEQVDKRFEEMEKRFQEVDRRFNEIDMRFTRQDQKIDQLELRLEKKIHHYAVKSTAFLASLIVITSAMTSLAHFFIK